MLQSIHTTFFLLQMLHQRRRVFFLNLTSCTRVRMGNKDVLIKCILCFYIFLLDAECTLKIIFFLFILLFLKLFLRFFLHFVFIISSFLFFSGFIYNILRINRLTILFIHRRSNKCCSNVKIIVTFSKYF